MNPLQRAAVIRKTWYLAAILGLFTLSMFWRGIIPIPLSGTARAAESRTAVQRAADAVAANTILNKSRSLDLRELEQGDAELEGDVIRLSMIGMRGVAVTYMWYQIMDAQKRNDFHEMEPLINWVTRLQPHFLTPWLYQSWNISYNVSVEMQGSGDMYHYIARGIDLLAEGERRNNHVYEDRRVGSPDMRYWIGFYYQNKFGVSDTVEVLRCLYQLSCIPPDERNPDSFIDKQTGGVDLARFREFCQKYPHLVRRLRGEDMDATLKSTDELTKKKAQEALKCPMPEHIIQFLRENNKDLPSRFKSARELNDPDKQFPVLPPKFNEGQDEFNPNSEYKDDFTGYMAAKAWYAYSLVPVPPNPLDSYNEPLPCSSPRPATGETIRPGEYDPFRYRIPRQPMLIIFRQAGARAQTAQAEQEQKEGWFDADGWRIDDPVETNTRKWWFPDPDAPKGTQRPLDVVVGGGRKPWSLEAWAAADEQWRKHGRDNGLIVTNQRRQQWEQTVPGGVNTVPQDPTDEEMADPELRKRYEARTALFFYPQNRNVTNFPYFLATCQVEAKPETVLARKVLWQAEQARKIGRTSKAIELYADGLAKWKKVLAKYPDFHRPDRSTHTEEDSYIFELAYLRLLVQDDERVRLRAQEVASQASMAIRLAGLVLPFQPFTFEVRQPNWARGPMSLLGTAMAYGIAPQLLIPEWKLDALEAFKWYVAEMEISPFAKDMTAEDGVADQERLGTPWIRPFVKENIRMYQGVGGTKAGTVPSGPPTPATAPLAGPPPPPNAPGQRP